MSEIHGHDESDMPLAERMRLLADQVDEEMVRGWADEVEEMRPAKPHVFILMQADDADMVDFHVEFFPELEIREDPRTWPDAHRLGAEFVTWLSERYGDKTTDVRVEEG